MEGGMTIESFVAKTDEESEEIDLDVTDERKEMLEKLSQTFHQKVVDFISDPDTDLKQETVSERINAL